MHTYHLSLLLHKIGSINHRTATDKLKTTKIATMAAPRTFSKIYPYYMSSKVETRDDNKKYLYLPIPPSIIDSVWSLAIKHVILINHELDRINELDHINDLDSVDKKIKKLVKRHAKHTNQPFHDIAPHISIAYNTTKSDPLQLITRELGSLDIELKFKVTKMKVVPPSMNCVQY